MQVMRWLDSMQAAIATAAAAGSFTALLVTRKYAWAHALTYFVIGQISAFYFTVPIADGIGLGEDAYGWVGFTIGVLAMLFWGGVITLFENLKDDPKGTLTWAWTLWKGGNKS